MPVSIYAYHKESGDWILRRISSAKLSDYSSLLPVQGDNESAVQRKLACACGLRGQLIQRVDHIELALRLGAVAPPDVRSTPRWLATGRRLQSSRVHRRQCDRCRRSDSQPQEARHGRGDRGSPGRAAAHDTFARGRSRPGSGSAEAGSADVDSARALWARGSFGSGAPLPPGPARSSAGARRGGRAGPRPRLYCACEAPASATNR